MTTGQVASRIAALMALWLLVAYGHRIGDGAYARPHAIAANVAQAAQRLQGKALSRSQLADALAQTKLRWGMTEYVPEVSFGNETNWSVRFVPEPSRPYNLPLWGRLLFMDFSRAEFDVVEVGATINRPP